MEGRGGNGRERNRREGKGERKVQRAAFSLFQFQTVRHKNVLVGSKDEQLKYMECHSSKEWEVPAVFTDTSLQKMVSNPKSKEHEHCTAGTEE